MDSIFHENITVSFSSYGGNEMEYGSRALIISRLAAANLSELCFEMFL